MNTFSLLSAPVGSYLLNVLDQRVLQIVVGSVLTVIFVKDVVVEVKIRRKLFSRNHSEEAPDSQLVGGIEMSTTSVGDVGIGDAASSELAPPDRQEDRIVIAVQPLGVATSSGEKKAGNATAQQKLTTYLELHFGPSWRTDISLGCMAGVATGLIGGMTGINGPPTFILLQHLNFTRKRIVTTGALITILSPRPFVYLAMGSFRSSEVVLYAFGVAFGLVGAMAGLKGALADLGALKNALSSLVLLGAIVLFIGVYAP